MSAISTNDFASGISQGGGNSQIGDGFSEMGNQEFLKVMFTELQNQDPFSPQDSQALLEQLSNLRNIESQLNLQESMEDLVLQNQIASAGTMIGKYIEGLDGNNNPITGVVKSVRVQGEDVILETADGRTVDMKRISQVTDAADAPGASASTSATDSAIS